MTLSAFQITISPMTTFRIGTRQAAALEIHVLDVAHEGSETEIPGASLGGLLLTIPGDLEQAARALTEAANGCDDEAIGMIPRLSAEERGMAREDRDALTALSRRVRQAAR